MATVSGPEPAALHAEHERMLEAFVDGSSAELLACAAAHHDHLIRTVNTTFSGAWRSCCTGR